MTRPRPTGGAIWMPEGTARLAFEGAAPSARAAIQSELGQRLRAADLPPAFGALAVELAGLAGLPDADAHRALAYLAALALWDVREGSTRTPLGARDRDNAGPLSLDTEGHLAHRLSVLASSPREADLLKRAIERLLDTGAPPVLDRSGTTDAPLVRVGGHLYLGRMRRAEDRLVEAWVRQTSARADPPEAVDAALADVLARPAGFALTGEQTAAVRLAGTSGLAVVTGGPGTGKTSVILAIVRLLVRLGVPPAAIVLAAPTGKAAHRMRQAVTEGLRTLENPAEADRRLLAELHEPRTLHRLLGYRKSTDSFQHGADFPLPYRAVVIDETSMIDLALMECLVSAAGGARLVLLGDAEQLPSVDAGAVLRDVTRSPPAAVHLTESHRMDPKDPDGRSILLAAGHLSGGEAARLFAPDDAPGRLSVRHPPEQLAHRGAEFFDPGGSESAVRALIARYDETCVLPPAELAAARRAYRFDGNAFLPDDARALRALLDRVNRHKILTVVRRAGFRRGAAAVNAALHRHRLRRGDLDTLLAFAPGEPVIVESNDYDRGLFNGDLGVVARVAVANRPVRAMAVFSTGASLRPFALDDLRDTIQLAHALTVHKAQGSELDTAVVLLPDRDLPLLSREVLYTAATRARRGVAFVGPRTLLVQGAARHLRRHSGVAEKLRARLGGSGS